MDALRVLGAFGVQIPTAFGGLGYTSAAAALTVERVARSCASTAAILMFHYQVVNRTLDFAHLDRRESDLVAMARGDHLAVSAWTEPGASSDKTNLSSTMTRSGNEFEVAGTKTWCTGLQSATTVDVLLDASYQAQLSCPTFVRIVIAADGVDATEIYPMLGLRATGTGTLQLTGVTVEESAILGEVGSAKALMQANHQIPLNPGLLALGIGAASMDTVLSSFPNELGRLDKIPHNIAPSMLTMEASYAYAAHLIEECSAGGAKALVATSKFKVYATGVTETLTRDLMHSVGSRGFLEAYALERHLRDAQATSMMGPADSLCLDRVASALAS